MALIYPEIFLKNKSKGLCQWKYSKGFVVGSEGNSNTVQYLEQQLYFLNEEISHKVTTLQRLILIWMNKSPLNNTQYLS